MEGRTEGTTQVHRLSTAPNSALPGLLDSPLFPLPFSALNSVRNHRHMHSSSEHFASTGKSRRSSYFKPRRLSVSA